MEATGRLTQVTRNIMNRRLQLTFEVDDLPQEELREMSSLDALDIKASKHKKRRSLDANSYFHVLCTKLAGAVKVSNARMKNTLLSRYGQPETDDDGSPVTLASRVDEDKLLERSDLHLWPESIDFATGWTVYIVLRGSHTYSTEEMSRLIDGTVEECKGLGIETMSPDRIARMEAAWANR